MMLPVHVLLDAVEPWMKEPLFSPVARGKLRDVATRLPGAWWQLCFECRLVPEHEHVDLQVCASKWHGSQAALASYLAADPEASVLGKSRAFVAEWARGDSLIGRAVPVIWLEYDLHGGGAPDPFVFMTLIPDYLKEVGAPSGRERLGPDELRAVSARGLELMLGHEPDGVALDGLERCAALLPAHGHILHLTTMPQRGHRDLRVSAAMRGPEVLPWLRAIGWPGDERALELGFELTGKARASRALHFDLGDAVRLEVGMDSAVAGPQISPWWLDFVDRLVALGLCDRDKGQAALDWVGVQRLELSDWPLVIQRKLFIKLKVLADGAMEAKAYPVVQWSYSLFAPA